MIQVIQPDIRLPKQKKIRTYVALLNQDGGTGAPTAIVLKNTLGGDLIWTRSGIGAYNGTLAGITESNTVIFVTETSDGGRIQGFPDVGKVSIRQKDTAGNPMEQLILTSIEVNIYEEN